MASGSVSPFHPTATTVIAGSTTSGAVALAGSGGSLLVYNATSSIAFLALGGSGIAADATGLPLPPGGRTLLAISPSVTAAAVMLSSGSGAVYLSRGSGSAY